MSQENPLTGRPYSRKYYRLQKSDPSKNIIGVADLPAQQKKEEFLKALEEHDILLLTGETGSGKSTQIPKIVYEWLNYNGTVVCTQPRTLTAQGIAARVAEEMDVELGTWVGFRYMGSEKVKGGDIMGLDKLIYMTDGTFVTHIMSDPSTLSSYGAVIVDEAHMRSVDIDIILYAIKRVLSANPIIRTKFIIMSATLDKDIFMNYYKQQGIGYMHISGRTFPVESIYLQESIYQKTFFSIYDNVPRALKKVMRELFGLPEPPPKFKKDNRDFKSQKPWQDRNQNRNQDRSKNEQDKSKQNGDRRPWQPRDRRPNKPWERRQDRQPWKKQEQQQQDQRPADEKRPWEKDRQPWQKKPWQKPWEKAVQSNKPWEARQIDGQPQIATAAGRQTGGGCPSYLSLCTADDWSPYDELHEYDCSGSEQVYDMTDEEIENEIENDYPEIVFQHGGATKKTRSSPKGSGSDEPKAVSPAKQSKQKRPTGDILVFMPTIAQLKKNAEMVDKYLKDEGITGVRVLTLSSQSNEEEKNLAKYPIPGIIKIIFSTDIAETGITIQGLTYVIDTGLRNYVNFRPKDRIETSDINFVSSSNVKQRKGRAGRMQAGICYHLYTEAEYKQMPSSSLPDLETKNIDRFLLQFLWILRAEPPNPIASLRREWGKFLTPLSKDKMDAYLGHYQKRGWLKKNQFTDLGECLMALRLNVDLSHLLLSSSSYRVEPEIMTDFVSMLEKSNRFYEWITVKKLPEDLSKHYQNPYGDIFGLYHVFLDYMEKKLPQTYMDMFRGDYFQKTFETSSSLAEDSVVENRLCQELVPAKFSLNEENFFKDIKHLFMQTFPENIILGENIGYNPKRDNLFVEYQADRKYLYLAKSEQYQLGKLIKTGYSFLFPLEETEVLKLSPKKRSPKKKLAKVKSPKRKTSTKRRTPTKRSTKRKSPKRR